MTSNRLYKNLSFIVLFLLPLVLSGCLKQPSPVYYHTLAGTTLSTGSILTDVPDIMLGPIGVTSVLDQKQLVRQQTPNSIRLEEQHRWAGDLPEMITDVLFSDLSLYFGNEKIYTYLGGDNMEGLQVEIYFLHFEEDENGMAKLSARWKVISIQTDTILYSTLSTYTIEPETSDYDGLAKGLSQGLSLLSSEISKAIISL
ncbi:MAG: PqiC family protein [Desulfocapsa sp.]|nr:PqiC family protein [Desulfocapsa sp.]